MNPPSSEQQPNQTQTVDEAASVIQAALVSQLAAKITRLQNTPKDKNWWERPGLPLLIAALIGGVGPTIEAISDWRSQEAGKLNEDRVSTRNRRVEYARLLLEASTPDHRLTLLSMIEGAPGSDEVDREWAKMEKTRVLNRIVEAERMATKYKAELSEVIQERQDAENAVQAAERQLEHEKKRRQEAEQRASASESQIQELRQREAQAESVVKSAQEVEATARAAEKVALDWDWDWDWDWPPESPSGNAPPGVPGLFFLPEARAALSGNSEALMAMMVWKDTPQGHGFWAAENSRLSRGEDLSQEAKDAISEWIRLSEK